LTSATKAPLDSFPFEPNAALVAETQGVFRNGARAFNAFSSPPSPQSCSLLPKRADIRHDAITVPAFHTVTAIAFVDFNLVLRIASPFLRFS
jgi:hypothetical protein